jgi:hypothetical protein
LNSTKIAGLDGVFFTYLGDFSMKRASSSPQEISLKVGSLSAQKGIVHPLFSISKHARCWTLRMYSIQKIPFSCFGSRSAATASKEFYSSKKYDTHA